ncbi:hypothetical protein DKP78_14545 [Enterococcus faecium]|nr:hypothetical protein DKP78_14545 [Enterococcus faecium]
MALMGAVTTIIDIFNKYAGKDGDAKTLSKGEVKELFKKEFGAEIESGKNQSGVDDMFKILDANSDGTVDFQEFMLLVASLTIILK